MQKSKQNSIKRITVTGVFISLSLVLKIGFSFYIPLFGQSGLSVGISGIFTALPSFLFGPWYGAAASGIVDVLGHIIKPAGAYMPLITLVNILGGVLRGYLWLALRERESFAKHSVISLSGAMGTLSVFSTISLALDGVFSRAFDVATANPDSLHFMSRLLVTRSLITSDPTNSLRSYTIVVTLVPFLIALFGFLLLGVRHFMKRRMESETKKQPVGIMQIFIVMLISGMIVSTLNTLVLRQILFESWQSLSFFVVWVPRLVESILSDLVNSYLIALLYTAFRKQKDLRALEI